MGDNEQNLPSTLVLSQGAIEAHVSHRVKTNPITLSTLVGGAGGLMVNASWYWGALGLASLATWPAYATYVLLAVGAGSLANDLWGNGKVKYTKQYVNMAKNWLRDEDARLAKSLRESLQSYNWLRGLKQLEELEDSFTDFLELLTRRFSSRGLTYGRAYGDAEQVKKGALKKLELILDQLKAIESIPEGLENELKGQDPESKIYSLTEERIRHRQVALEVIENLHTDIEEALTRISELSINIARVGLEDNAYDGYLKELEALASKVTTFNREI